MCTWESTRPGRIAVFAKIVEFCLGRDFIGSDDVEDAVSFDEQSGWTHGVWSYNTSRKEGAQTHSEKRIQIRRKSRENETRA